MNLYIKNLHNIPYQIQIILFNQSDQPNKLANYTSQSFLSISPSVFYLNQNEKKELKLYFHQK